MIRRAVEGAITSLPRGETFQVVYRRGIRHTSELGTIYILPRPGEPASVRVGIVVGKRMGTAVLRNHLRRRLREALRTLAPSLTAAGDIVIVPRQVVGRVEFQKLVRLVSEGLAKGRLAVWENRGAGVRSPAGPAAGGQSS